MQDSLDVAVAPAMQLTTLALKVRWIPRPDGGDPDSHADARFTLADARRMMCRSAGSKLRTISVGRVQYTVRCGPCRKCTESVADEPFSSFARGDGS